MSNPTSFPDNETTFFIRGPAGSLEVKAAPAKHEPRAVIVIICHPHPVYGGTMENKVVTTVFRAFRNMGAKVLRFNYRGVGESAGEYGQAFGETDDLLALIKWVKKIQPQDQLWLVGFSFGAFVAANAASQTATKQLLTIAPPVHHFDFDSLAKPPCPWIVIQGELDDVVPPELVFDWIKKQKKPPTLIKVHDAGHFFHGRLIELKQLLEKHYHQPLETLSSQ